MIIRALRTVLFLIVLGSTVAFGQTGTATPTNAVLLTVGGEVATPLKLTAADLAKLPRRSLRAKAHDGKEAMFEGVELGDVLKLAGVKFGEQLRGKNLALFLIAGARQTSSEIIRVWHSSFDCVYRVSLFVLMDVLKKPCHVITHRVSFASPALGSLTIAKGVSTFPDPAVLPA